MLPRLETNQPLINPRNHDLYQVTTRQRTIYPDPAGLSPEERDRMEFRHGILAKILVPNPAANPEAESEYKNNPARPVKNKWLQIPGYRDEPFSINNLKKIFYETVLQQADMHLIQNARKTLNNTYCNFRGNFEIRTFNDFLKSFDCPFEVHQLEKKIFFDELETLNPKEILEEMQDFPIVTGFAASCYKSCKKSKKVLPSWIFIESHPFIAFKVIESENREQSNEADDDFVKLIYFVHANQRWHQWNNKSLQPQLVSNWTTSLFNYDGSFSGEGAHVFKFLSDLVQNKEILDLQGKKFQLYHSSSPFIKNARKTES